MIDNVQIYSLYFSLQTLIYLIDVQSLHGIFNQLNVDLRLLWLKLLVWDKLSLWIKHNLKKKLHNTCRPVQLLSGSVYEKHSVWAFLLTSRSFTRSDAPSNCLHATNQSFD